MKMKVQACLRAFALCLAAGASGWIHVAKARTVFDASAALRAAADSAANPYTDAQGATWTVYGRTMANDGTTVPLAGQAVVTATPTAKGIGSYNDWCFVVGTAETEEKAISGLGSQPVKPGDLVFHPANTTRVALRFTPPRSGRYSFSAQFYTINPGGDPGARVDVTVMLNGGILMQEEVRHDNGQGAASSLCAHENVFLTTGDSLEFVVGAGFDNNNGADSTALTLSIVEEEKDAYEAQARYDANAAVAKMFGGETFVTPSDDQGATWALLGSSWSSWRNNETADWVEYYNGDNQPMKGFIDESWPWTGLQMVTNDEPWCRMAINTTATPQKVGIGYVGKDDIVVHPGNSHFPSIRFMVPERGTYLVTAIARAIDQSGDAANRNGIVLGLMAGGDQIAYDDVCCEDGGKAISLLQAQTPILAAGEKIDCQIHPGINNNNDTTVLRLSFVRLEDAAWKGHDLGCAVTEQFRDKEVTAGSFVDGNGGMWLTGWMAPGSNELNAFPQTGELNDGNLKGLTYDGTVSWMYLLANMTGAPLPGWFNTTYFPERSYVQMRELVFHPGTDKDPVLRVQVPKRGYYNITYHVRDIQPMAMSVKGVVMTVLKNGKEEERSGCWAGWWNDEGGCYEASIRLKDIYLKPSDRLDFRLNCDDNNGGDLTALRGWIVPSGKADDVPVPGIMIIVR